MGANATRKNYREERHFNDQSIFLFLCPMQRLIAKKKLTLRKLRTSLYTNESNKNSIPNFHMPMQIIIAIFVAVNALKIRGNVSQMCPR